MQSISKILLIHHTHTDIGYTHSQPVIWRLHRQIIDDAIDLCEETQGDSMGSVRWTCEVTATLIDWMKHASSKQQDRFRALVNSGHMGAGAFFCNMTPMFGVAEMSRSMGFVQRLRDEFSLPFRMAINHDVNGLPWATVGQLLDAGVDSLMMGLNPHFGGFPLHRPLVFDWEGPDGRTLRTFNAEHYSSFQRWLRPQEGSLEVMKKGLNRYLNSLSERLPNYPHDFILLSATHFDFVDNNPPDPNVARMVKRWNEEECGPPIEFVTSDQLSEFIHALPEDQVVRERGDWPDFWNFGCASSARETRIHRHTKARLRTLDLIDGPLDEDQKDHDEAWWNALLFDEHTWGSWATTWNHQADDVPAGQCHKFNYAYEARSLSAWVLRRALDRHVGNLEVDGEAGTELSGIAVINPAPLERCVMLTVPSRLALDKWQHYPSRIHNLDVRAACLTDVEECEVGPFHVPAFDSVVVPKDQLKLSAVPPTACAVNERVIESKFYRLEFEPNSGRIKSLIDRELGFELVDPQSDWDFLGFVRESVDLEKHSTGRPKYHGRDALFDTDFEKLSEQMLTGWKPDWPARREKPTGPFDTGVQLHPLGSRLVVECKSAPGATDLRWQITLPADRKAIVFEAAFQKTQTMAPEGIYFTIPLAIDSWRAWYDSSGVSVELDDDQLRGSVRDFQTVSSFASVGNKKCHLVLACPDAPMVQFGGFHFGKCLSKVPRESNCLLLAWPMNTYWDTNFPASQPGFQRFRYELTSRDNFQAEHDLKFGLTAGSPIEYHPVLVGASRPKKLKVQ